MRKIGIMGGTFNPIHNGHIMLGVRAKEEFMLDEVWFMPSGISYLKEGTFVLDAGSRIRLTKAAVDSIEADGYFVNTMEADRPGKTYTCDTLLQLRKQFPEDSFYLIYGSDCLFSIEKWVKPHILFEHAILLFAVRGEEDVAAVENKIAYLAKTYGAKAHLLPVQATDVSSSGIRAALKNGESIHGLVPDAVEEMLLRERYYSNESK